MFVHKPGCQLNCQLPSFSLDLMATLYFGSDLVYRQLFCKTLLPLSLGNTTGLIKSMATLCVLLLYIITELIKIYKFNFLLEGLQ